MDTTELHKIARAETEKHILTLSKAIDKKLLPLETFLDFPRIRVDLKGQSAGQASVLKDVLDTHWDSYINFNPVLMRDNLDYFIAQTIPHEVSHFVQLTNQYVKESRFYRDRPHGKVWQKLMKILGAKPNVRHKLDVRKVVKNGTVYTCGCKEWVFTKVRHNKVMRGQARYRCPKCGEQILPALGEV